MIKTYERETAIAISTIALLSLALKVKAISSPKLNYRNIMPLRSVTSSDVFTQEELHTITTCYDEKEPKGQFLQDRHGFTHYKVDGSGPMVVLTHGLATSIDVYEIITTELVNSGFKVLRYDFYGHGYSKHGGDETFFDYDTDLFVDQLEDVLEHVEKEEGVQAAAICGHSTGGNVCIAANDRWSKEGSKRGIAPKMILIAPAVYAKKPLLAKIADSVPGIMTGVMTLIPAARAALSDAYLEVGETAFARDPETKKYIYADAQKNKLDGDLVLFGKVKGKKRHPFLTETLLSINKGTLRGNLLPVQQERFVSVLKNTKSEVLWIWGTFDETVPFKENADEVKKWAETYDNFELSALDRIGHEALYEDPKLIASLCSKFLSK